MRFGCSLLAVASMFMPLPCLAQFASPLMVRQGEVVPVRLLEQISSSTGAEGETLKMEALADVVVDGRAIVLKGAPLTATITNVKKKAKMGTGGRLSMHISSVKMADGENLALNTTEESSGGGPGAKTYKKLVIASVLLLSPAGAAASLLLHGQEIILPVGTELNTEVADTVTLDRERFVAATDAGAVKSGDAPKWTITVMMKVETSAGDGSVSVDGKFLAEAPGTVELERGVHTVTVRRDGYKDWRSKVLIEGNPLLLTVPLQKK